MGTRCVVLHQVLLNHNIKHEYYVGGYGGKDNRDLIPLDLAKQANRQHRDH